MCKNVSEHIGQNFSHGDLQIYTYGWYEMNHLNVLYKKQTEAHSLFKQMGKPTFQEYRPLVLQQR